MSNMYHHYCVCLVLLCLAVSQTIHLEANRMRRDKNYEDESEQSATEDSEAGSSTKDDDELDRTRRTGPDRGPADLAALGAEHYSELDEETKTYERVVLEGSRIRIGCPHTSRAMLNNLKVQQQNYKRVNNGGGQKQFAPSKGETKRDVKWFRNHVPLMNINHFQHTQAAATNLFVRTNLFGPTTYNLNDGGDDDEEEEEDAGEEEPQQAELGDAEQAAPSLEQTVQQRSHVVGGEGAQVNAANVNEVAGENRKRSNMASVVSEEPARVTSGGGAWSWHVNELGELVVNNVSQYLAGKYTCLAEGRQSEILLDVLVDTSAQAGTLQARKISAKKLNETGGPSEDGNSRGSVSRENNNSISGGTGAGAGAGNEQPIEMDAPGFERRVENIGGSLVDNNPSLGSQVRTDSIITPMGGVEQERSSGSASGGLANGSGSEMSEAANSNKINVSRQFASPKSSQLRRSPVHVVKSEALQFADLKLVPGFLYTKQQLHCPVTGKTGLHFDYISSLLRAFCPTSRPLDSDNSRTLVRCYRLAQHLTARLMAADNRGTRPCSGSMFDLLWFKDGEQLRFDANGRGETGNKTNVKLSISPLAQQEPGAASPGESARAGPNQSSWLICPPDGRALEMEGLRKEAAGRYQCALRLDLAKLKKIIKRLRASNEPNKVLNWPMPNSRPMLLTHDNDISPTQPPSASSQQAGGQIGTNGGASKLKIRPRSTSRETTNGALLERIALLESILRGRMASEQSLNHIEHLVGSLAANNNPLVTVQTFSLLVAERPANSCDLWSTILEAENAYARRKLADFKRLKRGVVTSYAQQRQQADRSHAPATDPLASGESINTSNKGIVRAGFNDNDLTLNRMHLMQQVGHNLGSEPGLRSSGSNLLMNNAGDSSANANDRDPDLQPSAEKASSVHGGSVTEQRQIGDHQQTKSRRELLFDYANERNLRPSLYGRQAFLEAQSSDAKAAAAIRRKRSSLPMDFNDDLNEDSGNEYMDRDPITQRGYNIESHATRTLRRSFETPKSVPVLRSSFNEYHPMSIRRRSSESVIDDSSRGSASGDGGDNNNSYSDSISKTKQTRISAAADNSAWSRQLAQESSSQGNLETDLEGSKEVSHAPGYKLRQLGRFSRHMASKSLPQLDSQLNEPANQSNGLATSQALQNPAGNRSKLAMQNVSISGAKPERLIGVNDAPAPQSRIESKLSLSQPDETLSLFDEPSVYDDRFDECLMWKASQYLYMHMRAIASSSLFGAELAVEWSNERANTSESSIGNLDLSPQPSGSKEIRQSHLPSGITRDKVPFATINIIAGQNLQLECTAQALGRLPEIKWYKRIAAIPTSLKEVADKIVRRIGFDLYWPLTELDLLNDHDDHLNRRRSFVCSQTTAIFDNIVNQTFTVVTNLQLGQYNDKMDFSGIHTNSLDMDEYNLYACIVDADIRHNYATLGVHFREASNKIPLEIRKRLKARAISGELNQIQRKTSIQLDDAHQEIGGKNSESYHYRESLLQFPLQSHWVPIKNRTSMDSSHMADKTLPSTPTLLSLLIILVFGSLLALVYLTLKTYRALMQNQSEDDLNDENSQHEHSRQLTGLISRPTINGNAHSSRCICSCVKAQSNVRNATNFFGGVNSQLDDSLAISEQIDEVIFEAYNHGVINHCVYREILTDLPSESEPLALEYDHNSQLDADCCQLSSLKSNETVSRKILDNLHRVHVVENPTAD